MLSRAVNVRVAVGAGRHAVDLLHVHATVGSLPGAALDVVSLLPSVGARSCGTAGPVTGGWPANRLSVSAVVPWRFGGGICRSFGSGVHDVLRLAALSRIRRQGLHSIWGGNRL